MRRLFARSQDFWAGLLFFAFGVLALWIGSTYAIGTAQRMGPGYFPRLLGLSLCGLGALIAARGAVLDGPSVSRGAIRPFLVLAAVLAFALLLHWAGLVAATLVLVLISTLARAEFRLLEVTLIAATLLAMAVVVFVWGLGLPLPLGPQW